MYNAISKKTVAMIRSIRPETTPIGVISVYIGGLIAGAKINSYPLFLASIAAFFITSAGMTINDYFDWEVDKINHPKRPIPRGIITLKGMLYFSIVFFSIGLILSLIINILCFSIGLISIALLIIYESKLKNSGFSGNIIVAFVSSISFTFGGAAVGIPYSSAIISMMAFFIILGREIIMDIRDFDGDRLLRKTVPMKLGKKNAVYIACLFLTISGLITPIPFIFNTLSIWYLIIIIPIDMLTIFSMIMLIKDLKFAKKSAEIVRLALVGGLFAFIVGVII